jgi:ATP-binding protein involved in chromosome partitioning
LFCFHPAFLAVMQPSPDVPTNARSAELATLATTHLRSLLDPLTGRDWVTTRQLSSLVVDGAHALIDIALPYPARSQWAHYTELVRQHLMAVEGIHEVTVNWSTLIQAHASPPGVPRLPGVKNLIAVASGKGGVGKSTTAINVALALHAEGARVGMLDADIYGPSQPLMMGLSGKPDSPDGKTITPPVNHGLQMMSMGLLIADDAPAIWRGPMATQGLDQLLRLTRWGQPASDSAPAEQLDYLIVDMPPGTGDIHLSICQRAPLTAASVVTTPQDIALLDAIKGMRMFEKMNVPMLGVIENMAVYHCPACGHASHIFGAHGGQRMADQHQTTLLGSLPLAMEIREDADSGCPTLVRDPAGAHAQLYLEVARRMAARLSLLPRDYSSKLPPVTVANAS